MNRSPAFRAVLLSAGLLVVFGGTSYAQKKKMPGSGASCVSTSGTVMNAGSDGSECTAESDGKDGSKATANATGDGSVATRTTLTAVRVRRRPRRARRPTPRWISATAPPMEAAKGHSLIVMLQAGVPG